MNYLEIAQYMAFAVFQTIAVIHLLVWIRAHREITHLLFALTAAAAGINAIAETFMYRAESIDVMSSELRWYVAASGCWAIASVCFITSYASVGKIGKCVATVIVVAFMAAMVVNLFSPASFLYTEITGLRTITLPWGERIWLAIGKSNPWRLVFELAMLAILGLVACGCYGFWLRKERGRAIIFGSTVVVFMLCFGTHAFFVDTGRLDSPYLSTYGFLALVGLTGYDLAGEVMRSSALSSKLAQKESDLRKAVADERNRIAGELHDSVTQTLFSTAAIADAIPEVWRRSPDDAMRGLQDLRALTKGALAEMRALLLELHPASLLEKDLGVLLQQLASAATGRSRVPIELETEGAMVMPDDVQIAFYRAAQEGINNALKHADANNIRLCLKRSEVQATLTVCDDGCGLEDSREFSGMGLQLMRERIATIGGRLDVQSEATAGTTITVIWNKG
ncbi:Sensor histidine kinase LiaS [Planctomycetes bacterium CA13]|uniref:Sensor histidine kinase LiaS n=1 Tax=Novipirellula herctigrandis TaxID=2527986 RepID=A0A5C5Z2I0_9BACT|nr:Sensor histidine kinase LiaS [Planctomycetes bacterium CA13]